MTLNQILYSPLSLILQEYLASGSVHSEDEYGRTRPCGTASWEDLVLVG